VNIIMSDVSLSINGGAESHSNIPRRSSRGGATGPFGWAVELLLVFIFTTMLLMTYVARIQHDDHLQATAQRQRAETLDRMRREKLARLQRTIFVNPKRPPDHTYNMCVCLVMMKQIFSVTEIDQHFVQCLNRGVVNIIKMVVELSNLNRRSRPNGCPLVHQWNLFYKLEW